MHHSRVDIFDWIWWNGIRFSNDLFVSLSADESFNFYLKFHVWLALPLVFSLPIIPASFQILHTHSDVYDNWQWHSEFTNKNFVLTLSNICLSFPNFHHQLLHVKNDECMYAFAISHNAHNQMNWRNALLNGEKKKKNSKECENLFSTRNHTFPWSLLSRERWWKKK